MSDIDPQTPPQAPGATDGQPPAATNPQGGDGATKDNVIPDGFELIRTEDKNNLISSRDRANNRSGEADEFVLTLAKEREIDSFLEQHKTDYPDLTRADLMTADSPEQLEALAQREQRRIEDIVQKKLMDVQRSDAPVMTPQERDAELKRLRDNPGSNSFARMLELQMEP